MFDKDSPEIKDYVNQKLQEQAEMIAEKILYNYRAYDLNKLVECTGISEEAVDRLVDKYNYKERFKYGYYHGVTLSRIQGFYHLLKHSADLSFEQLVKVFQVNPRKIDKEAWESNPEKWAIAECKCHDTSKDDMIRILKLTEEEISKYAPTWEELDDYVPAFSGEYPTEERLEEAYQEYLQSK